MEDIFYFSKHNVNIVEIEEIASMNNYEYSIYDESIHIFYSERPHYWSFYKLSSKFEGLEPTQIKVLHRLEVESLLCVSHHVASINKLLKFIKLLMVRYQGWIAADDAEFELIYNVNNLKKFDYNL